MSCHFAIVYSNSVTVVRSRCYDKQKERNVNKKSTCSCPHKIYIRMSYDFWDTLSIKTSIHEA